MLPDRLEVPRCYGLPVGDLVQEPLFASAISTLDGSGVVAAQRFDPERNARRSTYASWWIMAAIQDYILRNNSIIAVPSSLAQRRLFFNLRRVRANLATVGRRRSDRSRTANWSPSTSTCGSGTWRAWRPALSGADSGRSTPRSTPKTICNFRPGWLIADGALVRKISASPIERRSSRSSSGYEALDTLSVPRAQDHCPPFPRRSEKSTLAEIGESFLGC